MGFDLSGRNGTSFSMGAFSWTWMLDAGVGLVIGYQRHGGGSHVYTGREIRGRDGEKYTVGPASNDGFPVTAAEARAMAAAARGLAACERFRLQCWRELPDERRAEIERQPIGGFYRGDDGREVHAWLERRAEMPIREDFIEKAEAFARWAEGSRGFRIY